MFAMSLYDYWNGGTTNEFYLYIPGHETEEMDPGTYEPIMTPDRMFNLGNSGDHQIIATINKVTVTGGIDKAEAGEGGEAEVFRARPLTAGVYSK
jgi:hypothetical protein